PPERHRRAEAGTGRRHPHDHQRHRGRPQEHRMTMTEIQKAAQIIQEGGIVAFPTETVYGLGADALNPYAVARIFEVKNRPTFDPLIVHVADMRQAEILVLKFPTLALKLA